LRKIETDLLRARKGLGPSEEVIPILLSEFTGVYSQERQKVGKAPRTLTTDGYALGRLLNYTGDCALTSITPEVALRYRDFKLESVKPTSASIELRTLRAAFHWAAEKPGIKYLYANPFRQKGMIPRSDGRTIPMILTPEEKARFLAAIEDTEHRQLFQFFLLTGCRRSEAANLKWADLDLEQKQVTFRKAKMRKDRTLPINLELMQIILTLDRSQPKPFRYGLDWTTHLFKRYMRKAKIEKDLHLHCLRHTAASDLVRKGVHLTKIQKFLGHSSVKVTEIYTHVLPEDLREAAEVLTCLG
jgi:integrase/recombinase XerD